MGSHFKEVKSKFQMTPQKCCRRAQTETERVPVLSGSKLAVTQGTHIQRLRPENKEDFPYIPFRAGYRNGMGVLLVPYVITCYFIGCFNL
jgi:hypothetical protein